MRRRENILGENPKNELLLLTDTYYPRLLIGRQEKGGELRTTEIDVEEFALVKSIRARGKRIAPYLIDHIEELPPLKESPVFEPEHDESVAEGEEEEADLFAGQTEDSSNE